MADEEKEGEAKPKGGMMKWIIIIAVILVLMIGMAIGGLIAFNKIIAPSLGLAPIGGEKAGETGGAPSKKEEQIGGMVALPPFIVNLAETRGKRFIKVTLQMEVSGEATEEEVQMRMPQIQDHIITVLSSKKMEQVTTAEGKFKLKEEIMNRVNQVLVNGAVKNIYYTEFVVQ